jgi:hypothetical protein
MKEFEKKEEAELYLGVCVCISDMQLDPESEQHRLLQIYCCSQFEQDMRLVD